MTLPCFCWGTRALEALSTQWPWGDKQASPHRGLHSSCRLACRSWGEVLCPQQQTGRRSFMLLSSRSAQQPFPVPSMAAEKLSTGEPAAFQRVHWNKWPAFLHVRTDPKILGWQMSVLPLSSSPRACVTQLAWQRHPFRSNSTRPWQPRASLTWRRPLGWTSWTRGFLAAGQKIKLPTLSTVRRQVCTNLPYLIWI